MLQECWNHANPTHEVKLLTSNCFISRVSIPGGGGKLSEEADEPTEDEEGEFGAAIVSGKSTSLVRHDGSPSSSIRKETLPSIETLQRLDLEELRCILAAHGVVGSDGKTKAQLLRMVEGAILDDDDEKGRSGVMLLENGKNGNEREEGSSEDVDDDDDEYNEVEVIDLT